MKNHQSGLGSIRSSENGSSTNQQLSTKAQSMTR